MMLAATAEPAELLVAGLLFAGLGYWLSERYRRNWGRTPWKLPSLLWAFIFFLSLVLGALLFAIAQYTTRRASSAVPGQSRPWYPPAGGNRSANRSDPGYPSPSGTYPSPSGTYPPASAGENPFPPAEHPPVVGSAPTPPGAGAPGPQPAQAEGAPDPAPPPGTGHRQGSAPASFPPTAYAPPGRPPGYVSPDPGARSRDDESPPHRSTAGPADASPHLSPAWLGDPTLRHELRYWNGDSWTDWVSDGGHTATDPYPA
jgi:hypothetical protein